MCAGMCVSESVYVCVRVSESVCVRGVTLNQLSQVQFGPSTRPCLGGAHAAFDTEPDSGWRGV